MTDKKPRRSAQGEPDEKKDDLPFAQTPEEMEDEAAEYEAEQAAFNAELAENIDKALAYAYSHAHLGRTKQETLDYIGERLAVIGRAHDEQFEGDPIDDDIPF